MMSLAKPLVLRAALETPTTRAWRDAASNPRVMHVFDRAVNLLDDEAGVLSLVADPFGAGPFTMVLEPDRPGEARAIRFNDWLDAKSRVLVEQRQLSIGRLRVLLGGSALWNPVLPWAELRAEQEAFLAWQGRLRTLLETAAPAGSFAPLISDVIDPEAASGSIARALLESAREPARELVWALAEGQTALAIESSTRLAGLGGGLTPSGDDFIIGAMYAVRLCAETAWAGSVSLALADSAGEKTVRISQAWLDAAARGGASRTWHALCAAIVDDDGEGVELAARHLLAVGHTSGADALTGFLMALDAFSPA